MATFVVVAQGGFFAKSASPRQETADAAPKAEPQDASQEDTPAARGDDERGDDCREPALPPHSTGNLTLRKQTEEYIDIPSQERQPPYDIGREFVGNVRAWRIDWDEFKRRHPGVWYSMDGEERRSIRCDGVVFFGQAISENTFTFGADGLERIEISVFNKGIVGAVIAEADALASVDAISSNIRAESIDVSNADDGRGKSITRYRWVNAYPLVTASLGRCVSGGEWGAEYLNFVISRVDESQSQPSGNPSDNVRRSGDDVYIDGIQMVNQGQKGYCAPATISRVLRYYGISADMNDLALVMETECGGGTKIGGKVPALDRIAEETGLRRTDYRTLGEVLDAEFFRRYNAAARDNGGEELNIEDYTADETDENGRRVRVRHYDWMGEAIDRELWRKSRAYDQAGYQAFRNGIVACVDRGYPLIWSVDRLFPWDRSDGRQGGGHMRLIVGYNAKADELLYSDSWGSGNEFKRAPMREGWLVTDFLSCLSPR